ncbi:MAG: hypothetical protein JXK08_04460 [Flavobacteriaceae bacterium]|nr:hypothetical protein [Flavobacteriaceae bacterium]
MKKLLIISTLLLVTNTLFAQTYDYTAIVNSAEEKNKPEEYIEYYESGQMKFKGFIDKDGNANGITTYYYENGNKLAEGMFENNKQQGEWTYFKENGVLTKKEKFTLGELNSSKQYYQNGQLKREEYYMIGIKVRVKDYYNNGNLHIDQQSANYPSITVYYENGEKQAVGNLKIDSKGEIITDKNEGLIKFGDWKYYDEDGNLTKTETYKDGKVISTKTIEEENNDFDIFGGVSTSSTSFNDDYEKALNSPKTIKSLQSHYMSEIKKMASYFGQDDTETYYFECFKDPKGVLFFKAKFKKDKVYYNGKYYYDVLFEIQVLFKDINSVTQNGNKIYFELNSNGYLRNAKPQGENWSGFVQNNNDFEITVYNTDKRKEALNAFKYLVEHPYKND